MNFGYVRNVLSIIWLSVSSPGHAVPQADSLVVSEIMYHPNDYGELLGQDLEYLELRIGEYEVLDLSRAAFTDGIEFEFPEESVFASGQTLVLVSNTTAFQQRYPDVSVFGEYAGQLSNSGENLELSDEAGNVLLSVEYSDQAPWPALADGNGYSAVLRDESQWPSDPNDGIYWRASSAEGGSPGSEDPEPAVTGVFINEILAHTDLPEVDSIEIYNQNEEVVDLSYWYVSDDFEEPDKFQFPEGTQIEAGGYLVVTETDLGYRLDSHGDSIWLFAANSNGTLTGYRHGYDFGASDNGVTFGRTVTSDGVDSLVFLASNSLGYENGESLVGPIVISEIQYDPVSGGIEYIEIVNTSEDRVFLYDASYPENGWKIEGIGYSFASGDSLDGGELALIVGVDPSVARETFGLPETVQIFGPFEGALNNSGESISIQFPDTPDEMDDGEIYVPYIDVDKVTYLLNDSWLDPDDGWSLERRDLTVFAIEPENWKASSVQGGSPGWLQILTYENWLLEFFPSESIGLEEVSGIESDPDGDGLVNLWEYALGYDPILWDRWPQIEYEVEPGVQTCNVSVSLFPSDLELEFQLSSNLLTWMALDNEGISYSNPNLARGSRSVEVAVPLPDTGDSGQFIRLVLKLSSNE